MYKGFFVVSVNLGSLSVSLCQLFRCSLGTDLEVSVNPMLKTTQLKK